MNHEYEYAESVKQALDNNAGPPTGPPGHDPNVLLQLCGISKQYPGTLALDDVSLDVLKGNVHVLFGENGAGKSTLIKIVAGVHKPTAGTMYLHGEQQDFSSVADARRKGVSAVFQEFSIVPQLTVEENMFLGSEPTRGLILNKSQQRRQARDTLERLGFPLKPNQHTLYLSRAEQQMVEIAKAFRTKPSIMILDEPTASLTEHETNQLFTLIATLKSEGIGIIYITHRMGEIAQIADLITVLRDGKYIKSLPVAEADEMHLVELMTGRVVDQIFPSIERKSGSAPTLLEFEHVSSVNGLIKDVSLSVSAGEIVGIAGLVGSGKSNIGRASFGAETLNEGIIRFCNTTVYDAAAGSNLMKPRKMLDRGLYYVPSDRREEGLVMMLGVRENVSLPSLELSQFSGKYFLRRREEKKVIKALADRLALSPPNIERQVEHFSGGNQQKVLIGKALTRDVKLYIFDEPTVGVDVGARMLIYGYIKELCEAGAGVILISSDLPEIVNLPHRTYVMHNGVLQAELSAEETTEENVLKHFFDK